MMERKLKILAAAFFAVSLVVSSSAFSQIDLGVDMRFFTAVFTQDSDSFFFPHSAGDFYFVKGEARIKGEGSYGDFMDFFFRTDFIYRDFPSVRTLQDLESITWDNIVPLDIRLYEAYVVLNGFPFSSVDVTVGKQRLKWGKADKLHVVDNLNPIDLANFFTFDPDYFGESLPTPLVDVKWYIRDEVNLELAYAFSFKPGSMPEGFWDIYRYASSEKISQMGAFSVSPENVAAVVSLPEWKPYKTPFGVRIFGTVFNVDYAVSYYRGYIDLPLPERVTVELFPQGATVETIFTYVPLNVVGLEWATELMGIGLWGEVGFYIPETTTLSLQVRMGDTNLPSPVQPVEVLKSFYVKAVAGMDYTFPLGEGLYVNFQYVHGFFDEMSFTQDAKDSFSLGSAGFESELEDYYLIRFEQTLLNSSLKLGVGFLLNIGDYSNFSEAHAYAVMPTAEWEPFDAVSFKLGGMIIDGKEGSKFGLFRKFDLVYLLAEVNF